MKWNLWRLLKEPKWVSALMMMVYSLFIIAGIFTWLDPPLHEAGILFLQVMGAITFFGGLTGLLSLFRGFWWAERGAIFFCVAGLAGYIHGLLRIEEGGMIVRLAYVLSLAFLLVIRFLWIAELAQDPTK